MQIEASEVLWFEQHVLTLPELAELSGLPTAMLQELFDWGAITPLEHGTHEIRFGASALRSARSARRLQADFELDLQGVAVALRLLERIGELEAQLQALRARLPQQAPAGLELGRS
jgi:chaperone modulatory protein CbpM